MTLTRYLTLYLYNPISLAIARRSIKSGKRFSPRAKLTARAFASRIALPTVATFFLAGIWHGSGRQFLVFGLLHGIYLTVNHAWRIFGDGVRKWAMPVSSKVPAVFAALSTLTVFLSVIVGQVFFRAKSVSDGVRIIADLAGVHGVGLATSGVERSTVLFLLGLLAVVWFGQNSQQIVGYSPDPSAERAEKKTPENRPRLQWQPSVAWAVIVALIFIYALMAVGKKSEFLYFQF